MTVTLRQCACFQSTSLESELGSASLALSVSRTAAVLCDFVTESETQLYDKQRQEKVNCSWVKITASCANMYLYVRAQDKTGRYRRETHRACPTL